MIESLFGPHPLIGVTLLLYGAAAAAGLGAAVVGGLAVFSDPAQWRRWRPVALAALALLAAAFLANTTVIAGRWIEAGRPPFKTRFETMLLYPWCVTVVTFVLVGLHRLHVLVPASAVAAVACLGVALARPDLETVNLMPALQSGWFVPHVVTYFIAYGALFTSCVLALLALGAPLWASRRPGTAAPAESGPALASLTSKDLAGHAHQSAVFGVVVLTLGLVMGAVWAKFAWGDYWTWDPKENWSLITWLAYMVYLHLARMPGWQGRRSAWLLVASFAAVMFTWLGMHLLPTADDSLHVYQ